MSIVCRGGRERISTIEEPTPLPVSLPEARVFGSLVAGRGLTSGDRGRLGRPVKPFGGWWRLQAGAGRGAACQGSVPTLRGVARWRRRTQPLDEQGTCGLSLGAACQLARGVGPACHGAARTEARQTA